MCLVGRAAELPGLNAHRAGTGPALLLLPGVASTVDEFQAVLPQLARRFDVLAVDLPGQGGSPALPPTVRPDIGALTDAVEQELDRRGIPVPHVLGSPSAAVSAWSWPGGSGRRPWSPSPRPGR